MLNATIHLTKDSTKVLIEPGNHEHSIPVTYLGYGIAYARRYAKIRKQAIEIFDANGLHLKGYNYNKSVEDNDNYDEKLCIYIDESRNILSAPDEYVSVVMIAMPRLLRKSFSFRLKEIKAKSRISGEIKWIKVNGRSYAACVEMLELVRGSNVEVRIWVSKQSQFKNQKDLKCWVWAPLDKLIPDIAEKFGSNSVNVVFDYQDSQQVAFWQDQFHKYNIDKVTSVSFSRSELEPILEFTDLIAGGIIHTLSSKGSLELKNEYKRRLVDIISDSFRDLIVS